MLSVVLRTRIYLSLEYKIDNQGVGDRDRQHEKTRAPEYKVLTGRRRCRLSDSDREGNDIGVERGRQGRERRREYDHATEIRRERVAPLSCDAKYNACHNSDGRE